MLERTRFDREVAQLGLGREHEVLAADRRTQLDRFLRREKEWQQWRVLALVANGAVEIERGGKRIMVKKAAEPLMPGDQVHIASPLPAAAEAAVNRPAAGTFRDYGIAPGPTAYDKALQEYLDLRPDTARLKAPDDLRSFIKALKEGSDITRPVRHLLLCAHAHESGLLGLRLHALSGSQPMSIADLNEAARLKMVEIPPAASTPRPKDPQGADIPLAIHIKGCRIGDNTAFLAALKKATGAAMVTAPTHFHFFRRFPRSGKLVELWEYMSYDFTVSSFSARSTLTRDQLIDLYARRSPPFTLIDKSAIPRSTWERWIPKAGWGRWTTRRSESPGFTYLETPVDIVSPVTGRRETLTGVAAVRHVEHYVFAYANVFNATPDPRRKDRRLDVLRANFEQVPAEVDAQRKRFGFATLDEMMAADWRFEAPKPGDPLAARLVRHDYTVMRPVVDPKTDTLYMNVFPSRPRTDAFHILDGDARFFGRA